jgi:thioredoxin-like negative regulator of GroEL
MASPKTSTIPEAAGPRKYSREIVLLTTLLLLLVSIAFTAFAARMYHKKYHVLADEWFAKGEQDFRAGNAAAALSDYRNALLYSPGNTNFQFHLAKALAATGRDDEARAYLTSLLSEAPGSGEINLELARIAAREGPKGMPEALRYYHAAIYGEWGTDSIAKRWQIRREFCEYLLNNRAISQAEAEIIELADNTGPEDLNGQTIAGDLLLKAAMWSRALKEFQTVLSRARQDTDGLTGAATASFELGRYSEAEQYFGRLPRESLADPKLIRMHEVVRNVVILNPFALRLSSDEQAKRTAAAFQAAQARARECAQRTDGTQSGNESAAGLQAAIVDATRMAPDWTERNLRRYPERIEAAMSAVFAMENGATELCGEPQGAADYALWLLGRGRGDEPR